MTNQQPAVDEGAGSRWTPFLWIILASALAHLWCLGSQFFLDDYSQIRDNDVVLSGHFLEARFSMFAIGLTRSAY